jgi:hypothetical protein
MVDHDGLLDGPLFSMAFLDERRVKISEAAACGFICVSVLRRRRTWRQTWTSNEEERVYFDNPEESFLPAAGVAGKPHDPPQEAVVSPARFTGRHHLHLNKFIYQGLDWSDIHSIGQSLRRALPQISLLAFSSRPGLLVIRYLIINFHRLSLLSALLLRVFHPATFLCLAMRLAVSSSSPNLLGSVGFAVHQIGAYGVLCAWLPLTIVSFYIEIMCHDN